MDVEIDEAEVLRLMSPKMRLYLRISRWNNIYQDWLAGKTFEEIGQRFDRHPSTIRRLLKYSIMRALKNGEMEWPVDSLGRKICNIAHPMPYGKVNRGVIYIYKERLRGRQPGFGLGLDADPAKWCHVEAHPIKNSDEGWCPCCQRRARLGYPVVPKTLVEVFGSTTHERSSLDGPNAL